MAEVVQVKKKIALLHRYTEDRIRETNAAFPYLKEKGIDVLTFKSFDRTNNLKKFFKSLAWIFYAPMLVAGKNYDVIYCDDSFPYYYALVKLVSPKSKVILRLGDLHLMYYTSGLAYKFLHWLETIAWQFTDRIIAISDSMGDLVANEIRREVDVILDPVEPKDFPYKLCMNHGTVMFHGLLTKNKNVDILLEAAKLMPEIIFNIVGDGPDRKRLEKKAPINVFFKGWIPFKDIYRCIRRCAVGVALRSDNSGNEYVVTSPFLQYGIMGKPCLVTRRKVFGDYEWQFSSVHELVRKLRILFVNPEEGERLRDYILENHQAKDIAEEIWSVLSA